MPNTKLEADKKLIKALTDCEPLDWSRRLNGDLVYLNEIGQKFILQESEIQKLRSATQGRGAEMSEPRRSPPAIGSDSTDAALARRKAAAAPAKAAGLRSDTQGSAAEIPEKRQAPSAIFSGSAPDKKSDPAPAAAAKKPADTSAAEKSKKEK